MAAEVAEAEPRSIGLHKPDCQFTQPTLSCPRPFPPRREPPLNTLTTTVKDCSALQSLSSSAAAPVSTIARPAQVRVRERRPRGSESLLCRRDVPQAPTRYGCDSVAWSRGSRGGLSNDSEPSDHIACDAPLPIFDSAATQPSAKQLFPMLSQGQAKYFTQKLRSSGSQFRSAITCRRRCSGHRG